MFARKPALEADGLTTQRIEAFSDGVFAIAITLLIIEIKVPHLGDHGKSLAQSLLDLWPAYFAYVLSFVMIGIYWANHHYVFHFYERTDHLFNLLNVFFLMWIAFLPFPTAVLGEYITNPQEQSSAITFYALGLLLPSVGWSTMWLYSCRRQLLDCRLKPEFIVSLSRFYLSSLAIYLFSFAVSFVVPLVSIALSVGLTFLYLFPPKEPQYLPAEAEA